MWVRAWPLVFGIALVSALPAHGEASRKDVRCPEIPDICAHLTKAFGKDFSTTNVLTELQVPEMEPFLPGAHFFLTNVSTRDPRFPAVDLLAARSPGGDGSVVSSVGPIMRDPDPTFLDLFKGVVVNDPKDRPAFAQAIAKVLEEMTYAGSVTDVEADGAIATAVLRYKGQAIRRISVGFDPDGRARDVQVTAAAKTPTSKNSHTAAGPAPDLAQVDTVRALVKALAGGGVSAGAHRVEAQAKKGKRELTIARGDEGFSVEVPTCGEETARALDVTLQLTLQHGLFVHNVSADEGCATVTVGGITSNEVLAEVVAKMCGQVLDLKSGAPVTVTATAKEGK
jgi:hypothetical protein